MLATSLFLIGDRFRFDPSTRELCRVNEDGSATPLALGSRAVDVLLLFLRRPGELVTREEIVEAVWPNTTVEDSNLRVQIAAVRRALDGGRDGGSAILTEPGRGYRLTLPVRCEEQAAVAPPFAAATREGSEPDGPPPMRPSVAESHPIADVAATPKAGPRIGRRWLVLCGAVAAAGPVAVVVVKWLHEPQFDVSGVWQGSLGGIYTFTQSGKEVSWEAVSRDGGVQWTSSFKGEIHGRLIVGRFFDHPPGKNRNAGLVTVEVVNNNVLKTVAGVRTFGETNWIREPASN